MKPQNEFENSAKRGVIWKQYLLCRSILLAQREPA